MNPLRSTFREDHGAIALTVAILLIVFLGFAALAVDMGYLYTVKRQLQSSADAAALSGVRELLEGNGETGVLAVAEEYAEYNAEIPADGLVMLREAPLTEVGSNFVRVTVEKESPLFFGRAWAADPTIQATAEARVAYVTGMRGLVPIGLPILRVTRVYAWLDGSPSSGIWLVKDADGEWRGNLPIPALAASTSRKVNLDVYNGFDYKETYLGVSAVHAVGPASPFQSVLTPVTIVVNHPGSLNPGSLQVAVNGTGETTLRFNGLTHTGMDSYVVTLPSPGTTSTWSKFPIDLFVGDRATGQPDLPNAAIVNSVRSTHPVSALGVGPRFFAPATPASTSVAVGFQEYEFGTPYQMKVSSGSEAGNLGPVNFHGGSGGSNTYSTDLLNGYDGVIYIGQEIPTEPGNMNASHVRDAYEYRESGVTFEEWVSSGMPRSSPSLVYVPVVEKFKVVTGTTYVKVVSFAAFYIESYDHDEKALSGRFIEYVLPSDVYSDTPPDSGMFLETYRLVTPQTEQ